MSQSLAETFFELRRGTPQAYGMVAVRVWEAGYHPIPIIPGGKKPIWPNWQDWGPKKPTRELVERWAERYPDYNLGITCGHVVIAIDIDELDPNKAADLEAIAHDVLGVTPLVRVGQTPKRILVYAVEGPPIRGTRVGKVDILGQGQQFVAFGRHVVTGRPYTWPLESPAELPVHSLPRASQEDVARLVDAFRAYYGLPSAAEVGQRHLHDRADPVTTIGQMSMTDGIVRDQNRRVIDGRDKFLFVCVCTAYQQGHETVQAVATAAWADFERHADLRRPKRDGRHPWTIKDARSKAKSVLRRGIRRRTAPELGLSDRPCTTVTPEAMHGFRHAIVEASAARRLSPAATQVSNTMLGYVGASGICFASVATIAEKTSLSLSAVNKARRQLREAGFWIALDNTGGRHRTTDYVPNLTTRDAAQQREDKHDEAE